MRIFPDKSTMLLPYRAVGGTLHIAVAVDAAAAWIDTLIALLRDLPGIQVTLLRVDGPAQLQPGWITSRLHNASRRVSDPLGPPSKPMEFADHDSTSDIDLVLWLAHRSTSRFAPRYGTFSVQLGRRPQGIPFWDEVASDVPVSQTSVFWHESVLASGRAVRVAETSTEKGLYFTKNAEEPVIAAIRMLATLCLEVLQDPVSWVERASRLLQVESDDPINGLLSKVVGQRK